MTKFLFLMERYISKIMNEHMKLIMKLVGCLMASMIFVGCYTGKLPGDDVGLPVAIAHCAESASYWIWGILVTCGVAFGAWKMKKAYDESGTFSPLIVFAMLVALLLVWLYRPSEIAWNTTVEQAARGVWIGY